MKRKDTTVNIMAEEEIRRIRAKYGLEEKESPRTQNLCGFLDQRMVKLTAEVKREPELAKKGMAALEETLRVVLDHVFDEKGNLLDKPDLDRRKRRIVEIHNENARIWLQRMAEVLEIAEQFNCPNINNMRRMNEEAMNIITSELPELMRTLL